MATHAFSTKRIALAAALGIGLVTPTQAAEAPWIIISQAGYYKRDTAAIPALIYPALYDTVTACFYQRGQIEMYRKEHFPTDRYIVWCAQVPGLSQ